VTFLRNSETKKYLLVGTSEGSVIVKPNEYGDAFVRIVAHSGLTSSAQSAGGVSVVRMSYDDGFVVSAGMDGTLAVHRLHSDDIARIGPELSKDIDAGIYQGVSVKPENQRAATMSSSMRSADAEPEYMWHVEVMDYSDDLDEHELLNEIADNLMAAIGGPMASPSPSTIPSLVPAATAAVQPSEAQQPQPAEKIVAPAKSPKPATPSVPDDGLHQQADAVMAAATAVPAPTILAGLTAAGKPSDEAVDVSSNAYSIQDAKLKMEEDARRVAAEVLKSKVREQVRALQADFEALRDRNNALPECVRLADSVLALDGDYLTQLRSEGAAQAEEVHKEMAYESEKSVKLLSKVTSRLMHGLLVEEMPLHTFNRGQQAHSSMCVKSLRTRAIDPVVGALLESIQKLVKQGEIEDAQARASDAAKSKAQHVADEFTDRVKVMEEAKIRASTQAPGGSDGANPSDKVGPAGSKDGSDHKQTDAHKQAAANKEANSKTMATSQKKPSALSARREMRKARKSQLFSHEKDKPSEDTDDPRDVNAIIHAEKTMGDYKLKCADDYEVVRTAQYVVTMAFLVLTACPPRSA
jgi:hypothetical protein